MSFRTIAGALVAIGTVAGALGVTTVSANARPPGPPWCWTWHHHHWRWVCPANGYRSYDDYRPGIGIYLGNGRYDHHHHHHHDHDHDHMDHKPY